MKVTCKKCGNTWDYQGHGKRISCSKCRTSITLQKKERGIYRMSMSFIEGSGFAKAKAWAKTNGQDYIELKPDKQGVLSLA